MFEAITVQNEKNKFDELVELHRTVKNFKLKVSFGVLKGFQGNTKNKFKKTIIEREDRMNLSSTATCTYALTQYFHLWSENKQPKINETFSVIKKYWDHLLYGLLNEADRKEVDKKEANKKEADEEKEKFLVDEFSILNVLCLLEKINSINNELKYSERIKEIVKMLYYAFANKQLAVVDEEPHPFIYYKFIDIIKGYSQYLDVNGVTVKTFLETIYKAGKYEMYRQIAFHDSNDKSLFDVKKLIYSLLIVTNDGRYSDNLVVDKCLEIIFNEQLETGLLRIGHVVTNDFVIKNDAIEVGSIATIPLLSSFECFNDMLSHEYLKIDLKNYCKEFGLAFEWIQKRLRQDKEKSIFLGWFPEYESSKTPESWVSSHILIFLQKYCMMLSDIISESASSYLQVQKIEPEKLYDSYGIKGYISKMQNNSEYCSALVFGPPGTGKSTIAKVLANNLKWAYIELTPGLFLEQGQSNIIRTLNDIFKRLARIQKAVIFFDEVDQLVKSRELDGEAWIVTALLPKLAKLRKQKEIKFILATNHIEQVDSAILREGRIDLILPMGGIYWKDRLNILNELLTNVSKTNRSQTVADELKQLVPDKPEELCDTSDLDDRIKKFLERTNFLSYYAIKKLLNDIFGQENISEFQKNPLYNKLFIDGKIDKNDKELRTNPLSDFHDELLGGLHDEIRLPLKHNVNIKKIIENNIF